MNEEWRVKCERRGNIPFDAKKYFSNFRYNSIINFLALTLTMSRHAVKVSNQEEQTHRCLCVLYACMQIFVFVFVLSLNMNKYIIKTICDAFYCGTKEKGLQQNVEGKNTNKKLQTDIEYTGNHASWWWCCTMANPNKTNNTLKDIDVWAVMVREKLHMELLNVVSHDV